jgi:hypothetical protein
MTASPYEFGLVGTHTLEKCFEETHRDVRSTVQNLRLESMVFALPFTYPVCPVPDTPRLANHPMLGGLYVSAVLVPNDMKKKLWHK